MARHVFTVPIPSSDAGIPNDALAVSAQKAGLSAEPVHSVANALKLLHDTWPADEIPPRILIGGSLYLAGEVLEENNTPPT
jgi:dihydrofolate synthase/folylpolyglutamate synthase